MTTKKRRFIRRGLLLVLGVGLVVVAWNVMTRWLELRDYTGEWDGWAARTTPSGAVLPWNTTVTLWKSPSGGWAGTFLYRDGWRTDRLCVGHLVQQPSDGEGLLFAEEKGNCPAGRLRAHRSERYGLTVSRSGGDGEWPGNLEAELEGMAGERSLRLADTAFSRAPRRWEIIRPGQTIRGALAPGDEATSAWGEVDTYLFAGEPGVPVMVTAKGDSMFAVISWGTVIGSRWVSAEEDAAEVPMEEEWGSRRAVMPRGQGDYGFRITGGGGRNGSYTVTVEPAPSPERTIRWLPRLEREGEVSGRLEESDSTLAPPTDWIGDTQRVSPRLYDTYAFFAAGGERITITMRAEGMDPVLWIGVVQGGEFVPLKSSATAPGGEAVLIYEPSEPGDYVVRAASLAPKAGAYTIRTDDAFPDAAAPRR